MTEITGTIRNVTKGTLNDTPVIKYAIPTWNRTTRNTEWTNITAWEPANPEQYRNGKKVTVTFTSKPKRNGGFFNNQKAISFAKTAMDAQLSLPGM